MKKNLLFIALALIITIVPISAYAKNITITLPIENGSDITEIWNSAAKDAKEDLANEYTIVIPKGTYTVEGQLKLWSNTHVIMNGATLKNVSGEYTMLRLGNVSDLEENPTPGYSGFKNISIEGGTFDGGGYENAIFRVGHAQNITLKNVVFTNVKNAHHVEFGAVKDVLVEGCTFSKFIGNFADETNYEALQIDALAGDHFSSYAPNDDETPSVNVTIKNNTFDTLQRGVGTHTGVINSYFDNIKIINNIFNKITGYAIIATNYTNALIDNNVITNSGAGIIYRTIEQAHENFYASKINNNIHNKYVDMKSKITNNKITITKGFNNINYKNVGYAIELYGENLAKNVGSVLKGDYRVSGVNVSGNVIALNNVSYGIWLQGAIDNIINNNKITTKFTSNTFVSKDGGNTGDGIKLVLSEKNTISGNTISNTTAKDNRKLAPDMNGINLNQKSNNNKVLNNTINNSIKDGIHVDASNSNTIQNNKVNSSLRHGINIESSKGNIINKKNTIDLSAEFGIRLSKSSSNTIESNTITNNSSDAIHVETNSTDNTIKLNTLASKKRDGINIQKSNSNKVLENTISSVKRHAINIESSNSNTIKSNVITKPTQFGIRLYSTKKNIVQSNTINKSKKDGIHIENANNDKIMSNTIKNITEKKDAIYVTNSKVKTIEKNTITNIKRYAINLEGTTYTKVYKNKINDITGFAIRLSKSNTNNISTNKIKNISADAIHLEKSESNTIKANTISKVTAKKDGIYLSKSNSNTIESNTIDNVKRYAINIEGSKSNKILSNTLKKIKASGIRLSKSKKTTLTSNTIKTPGTDGIHIEGSSDSATLTSNTITGAKRDAVNITDSSKISLSKNKLNDSVRYGIKAEESQIKKDSKNTIENSGSRARSWKK